MVLRTYLLMRILPEISNEIMVKMIIQKRKRTIGKHHKHARFKNKTALFTI